MTKSAYIAAALVCLIALAGCGSGSSTSSSSSSSTSTGSTAASASPKGVVRVTYQRPSSPEDRIGKELLVASETKAVAAGLAKTFELPKPLTVKGVNGFGSGPFYDPEDNSITLPYGFAALIFGLESETNPGESEYKIGERIGAINSFIFAHEFGHALIADYELPVLGKEEDAADAISTLVLLTVPNGAEYAASAAAFWADFSGRQEPPALAAFADQHSLDLQRAFDILCWIAGSSEVSFQEVAELEALPPSRLEACPGEYELLAKSFETEVDPHLRHRVDLSVAE
jgi:Putative metallopeptidase